MNFRILFSNTPTPVCGLALGIASLGWCWNQSMGAGSALQTVSAMLAAMLIAPVIMKFLLHPEVFVSEISHPVIGSVIPTLSMALMVISTSTGPKTGLVIWCIALLAHSLFLAAFLVIRSRAFRLEDMVPSWFVPPVGIIVACLTASKSVPSALVEGLLWFGLISYLLLLPIMLNRLIFKTNIHAEAQPTVAIMAAPASLTLTGYLTVIDKPDAMVTGILLGVALLMTTVIYIAFVRLLRLPFSAGFAGYTFPMVIGATAIFKVSHCCRQAGLSDDASYLQGIATVELIVASGVVCYVSYRFLMSLLIYKPKRV